VVCNDCLKETTALAVEEKGLKICINCFKLTTEPPWLPETQAEKTPKTPGRIRL
jgi:hypothetical protein